MPAPRVISVSVNSICRLADVVAERARDDHRTVEDVVPLPSRTLHSARNRQKTTACERADKQVLARRRYTLLPAAALSSRPSLLLRPKLPD